jgi:hypothetical protein
MITLCATAHAMSSSGASCFTPQATKDQPWFWTIMAHEIPPSADNRGYAATREQPMADFKARWLASIN